MVAKSERAATTHLWNPSNSMAQAASTVDLNWRPQWLSQLRNFRAQGPLIDPLLFLLAQLRPLQAPACLRRALFPFGVAARTVIGTGPEERTGGGAHLSTCSMHKTNTVLAAGIREYNTIFTIACMLGGLLRRYQVLSVCQDLVAVITWSNR